MIRLIYQINFFYLSILLQTVNDFNFKTNKPKKMLLYRLFSLIYILQLFLQFPKFLSLD